MKNDFIMLLMIIDGDILAFFLNLKIFDIQF